MASAPNHIDPTGYLDDLLAQASPDLMRCCCKVGRRAAKTQFLIP